MDKNSSKKKSQCFKADIISDGKVYPGLVKDVSKNSQGYVFTSVVNVSRDFIPKKNITLVYQTKENEQFSLDCEFMKFSRTSPYADQLVIGLKVIDPPLKSRSFVNLFRN